MLSITYLALIQEQSLPRTSDAWWQDWYRLFPWEDHRGGTPAVIKSTILPALDAWVGSAADAELRQARQERVAISFGSSAVAWDPERALERYELLWEAGLVEEFHQDQALISGVGVDRNRLRLIPGRSLAYDHRRITATAISRIRGKIQYRPVVFELLPETFTLLQLQRVVEALSGGQLHKQNFRRLVERAGLVEGTGEMASTGGRPAELFRFRRDVLLERPSPGVGRL